MALNNLGNRYSEVGRRADAVAPTEEAVTLYQAQAEQNPAYLSELAGTLNSLEQRYADAGQDPARFDTVWDTTVQSSTGQVRSYLWWRRAAAADPGDPRAAAWVTTALSTVGDDDPELTAGVHEQARRHRVPGPTAFDTHWANATGQPPPGWLLIDLALLAAA